MLDIAVHREPDEPNERVIKHSNTKETSNFTWKIAYKRVAYLSKKEADYALILGIQAEKM
jgi:hypothetical protein